MLATMPPQLFGIHVTTTSKFATLEKPLEIVSRVINCYGNVTSFNFVTEKKFLYAFIIIISFIANIPSTLE